MIKASTLRRLFALLIVPVVAGCGGGGSTTEPPPPPDPSLTWTLPASGANIVDPPQTLEVTVADGEPAEVEFRIDGVVLATDDAAPWTAVWPADMAAEAGIHTLRAIARDAENEIIAEGTRLALVADRHTALSGLFGGSGEDAFRALALTPSGKLFAAGEMEHGGQANGWVVALTGDGAEAWFNDYGAGCLCDVAATDDGGCVLAGWTWEPLTRDGPNQWVVKTDATGAAEWTHVGGSQAAWEYPLAVVACADGGYVVTGRRQEGASELESVLFVRKIGADGDRLWQHDDYTELPSSGNDIIQTAGGGYLITGARDGRLWLLELDAAGGVTWSETYANGGNYTAGHAVVATSGGYVATGVNDNDLWLLAVNASGAEQWSAGFDGGGDVDQGRGLAVCADGGTLVTGSMLVAGDRQLVLLKTDAAGDETWRRLFGGAGDEEGLSVVETDGGNILVGGWSDSGGDTEAWIIETTSNGTQVQD